MIIAGETAKQLGVLSKKKWWWKKRKRKENFGHWFCCHFGTYLEHFLESILYILYTVSKLRKSEVQRFKRCLNRSWNKKVMVITRKLRWAKRKFRTVQNHLLPHKCPFASSFLFSHGAKQLAKKFFFSKTTSESGRTCENPSKLRKSKI